MRKNIVKIAASTLIIASIVTSPLLSRAEDTGAKTLAASAPAAPAKPKKQGVSFLGKLIAVDTNAMSLTVSNITMQVTPETKIKTGSKPAKLSDAVVGQPTSGTYEKAADGKLVALTLHLNTKSGGRSDAKGSGKKKKASPETGGSN